VTWRALAESIDGQSPRRLSGAAHSETISAGVARLRKVKTVPTRTVRRTDSGKVFHQEASAATRLRNAKHYAQYSRRWTAALGSRPLRQIVPGDMARYVARRQHDGKAPATINRELPS